MGCILDYVAVMLVQRPLGKTHTSERQPIGGGGVPWCRHVDVTTIISPWVKCNSSKRVSLTSPYAEPAWTPIQYSNDTTRKVERWQRDRCPSTEGSTKGSRQVSIWSSWSSVSCHTITGARVMWWRCVNPPIYAGSLSTNLRESALVREVELPGFD